MPSLFRNLLIATGVLSALSLTLVGFLHFFGSRIDPHHVTTYEDTLALSSSELWSYVADIPKQVEWNEGIVKVEELQAFEGHRVWRETYHTGDSLVFYISDVVERQSFTRTIHDPQSPFQGYWTIEIEALNDETSRIVVTEYGQIKHTILRFLAHNVMGIDTFIKSYVENIKTVAAAAQN
ncbi:MAG: hypothetical protein ACOH5I_18315 [Oligoflexus sp.]